MGFDSVQIRVFIRKLPMNAIRLLYRSVCNHPFLVGFACILLLLFRSFPFLLSLLVSASPVLVCTAVLLGALLSFGQANIPEIEKEGNVVTHQIASLQACVSKSANVVERDASFTMERLAGLRVDIVEKAKEQASSVEKKACKIGNAITSSVSNVLSKDGKPHENQNRKQQVDEDEGKSVGLVLGKKMEIHDEKSETKGMVISQERNENLQMETDKSPVDSMGSHTRRQLDSKEDDESDWAESSSSDASMTEIIPMLDELHPLLDDDAPQPDHMSHEDSDAGPEHYSSHDEMIESDEDSENKGEEVDGDDEEEATPWNNGATSSPIIWTEDDHKNVIDIGTSEIERNRRLESLIARMKARKPVNMDSADLTFNIPPVTTVRRNPFDDDHYNDTGLPPVPGSAPSIMLPRQNPFDVPDDSYYDDMGLPPIPGSAPSIIMPRQNPFATPFDEVEISIRDLEIHPILEEEDDATTIMELKKREIDQKSEPVLPVVMPGVNQGARKLELKDTHTKKYGVSKQSSHEESELNLISGALDDSQQHGDEYFRREHDEVHNQTKDVEVHPSSYNTKASSGLH